MRNASTLVGLTLLALASTARAEEAAPAADKTAPAADKAAPAADKAAPADKATTDKAAATDKAATPASEPVKAVPAEADVAAAPASGDSAARPRRWQLGLSFLPMSMGTYTYVKTATVSEDAYFAYGASLSAVYEVLPGLLVGLAPQLTFNVRPKAEANPAKQVDVMARVAYLYRLPDGLSVFAEVLPGYSMILLKHGAAPKGLVLAFGAGCTVDLNARTFASIGVGYQIGYQNQAGSVTVENRTKYLRVALGGGVRF